MKRLGDTRKVVSWKSIGLSTKKFTTPTTTDDSLSLSIKNLQKSKTKIQIFVLKLLNPIQVGPFQGCSTMGGEEPKRPPPLKICHIHPTIMKLDTVIHFLKKIQKRYKSFDTPLTFC